VETVRGIGYRLISPSRGAAPAAASATSPDASPDVD
jgi:hypothetical protein